MSDIVVDEKPEPNPFERLIGVFLWPVRTMQSIARRPDWLLPLAVIVVVAIVSSIILTPRMDIEGMLREQMAGRKDVSQEQIDSMIKVTKKIQPLTAVFGAAAVPIAVLAAAGLFFVALQMFGGDAKFPQVFSVTAYGWLPIVVQRILLTALVIPRARIRPDRIAGLLKSSLGSFLPVGRNPALLTLCSSIDVFVIWTLILLIIGYSFAAKLKRGTVAAIVLTIWIVVVLLLTGFAGLGSMMQG
ncbi:MAG TPA: Yip1 family protein [Thermoanaerobaculia bacterium]|nr:Yip1 family protein [Thermoanaerobaculia bacterium]